MKPDLECCTPYNARYPSGYRWTHSNWCSVSPRAKVDRKREPDVPIAAPTKLALVGGVDWGESPEDVPERLEATAAHPACIAAAADGATPCSRCSWLLDLDNEGSRYIDEHLDRLR